MRPNTVLKKDGITFISKVNSFTLLRMPSQRPVVNKHLIDPLVTLNNHHNTTPANKISKNLDT